MTQSKPKNNDHTPFSAPVRSYSLIRIISITIHWLMRHNNGISETDAFDLICFKTNASLSFPGSDVEAVTFEENDNGLKAFITLNLPGLHGSSSPLPADYIITATDGDAGGTQVRDFFDLFHHRLNRLIRQIWLKYRYHESFRAGATDIFSHRMFALIGLGHASLRKNTSLNWRRLLPYLGLLSQRSHSAALIEAILKYYFQHEAISVEQCVPREVPIRQLQQNKLGLANSSLDNQMLLGETVIDRSVNFRIHIKRLSQSKFNQFLPGSEGYRSLNELVQFILKDPLDYDLFLQMQPEAVTAVTLADSQKCTLGQTSWLGNNQDFVYSLLIQDVS